MAPAILVVGATGNTGQSVIRTLSSSLKDNTKFSNHRILAQTRSKDGAVAQQFAQLPGVTIVETSWLDITSAWLREHEVVRVFIAAYNSLAQFTEESAFLVACLDAGIEYVVRISTTAANVRPNHPAYYVRSHWAIEATLNTPEFSTMKWTSLQANAFLHFYLYYAAAFVMKVQETGKREPLSLMASEDGKSAPIHPDDIGTFAAKLLLLDDPSPHNHRCYEMAGPEDISGGQVVDMIEKKLGEKVQNVTFKDLSMLVRAHENAGVPKTMADAVAHVTEPVWAGRTTASRTSEEVLEIHSPKITPAEVWESFFS